MQKCRRFFLLICSCLALFSLSWAQNASRKFVLIKEKEMIVEGENYLIGGFQRNKTKSVFALLASRINAKGKAMCVTLGGDIPSVVTLSEEQIEKVLWQLSIKNGRILLKSEKGTLEIEKPFQTNLTLRMTTSQEWELVERGGEFQFSQGDRFLTLMSALQTNGTYKYDYGAYKTDYGIQRLQIYREVKDFKEQKGMCTFPEMERPLTLGTSTGVVDVIGNIRDKQSFCLRNGELAHDKSLLRLMATAVGDTTFRLTAVEESVALPFEIKSVSTWCITNGYLSTAEQNPRFLVLNNSHLELLTSEEVTLTFSKPLQFLPLAPQPKVERQGKLLCLTGGWTTEELQNLAVNSFLEIDFTKAILPIQLPDIFATPLHPHCVMRLSEKQDNYPSAWSLIVVNDTLQRESTLLDGESYTFTTPFFVGKGQLRYTREIQDDDGWETLCLPFTTEVPKQLLAERLQERQYQNLTFVPTDSIKAGEPVILHSRETPSGQVKKLSLTSLEGWTSMPLKLSTLEGVADTLYFSESEKGFLLDSSGQLFIKAQSGSRLRPFRAYLSVNENAQMIASYRITGLSSRTVLAKRKVSGQNFDLSGRIASKHIRGLVITAGKKEWYAPSDKIKSQY